MEENVKASKSTKELISAKIAGELLGLNDIMTFVVNMRFKNEEGKTFSEWKKVFIAERIVSKEEIAERDL